MYMCFRSGQADTIDASDEGIEPHGIAVIDDPDADSGDENVRPNVSR